MPHPGDEANGMCPSKEAKNRTQSVYKWSKQY